LDCPPGGRGEQNNLFEKSSSIVSSFETSTGRKEVTLKGK